MKSTTGANNNRTVMKISPALNIICLFLLVSCQPTKDTSPADETEGLTPVTVTHATIGSLTDVISLNATAAFLLKTSVKSDINGYLQKVNIHLGQRVSQGQELFTVRSKESEHLGTTISRLDTSLRFSGLVHIKSPASGYITALSYQAGDYVQDNEVLATISDLNSLVFLLELPYELNTWLTENKSVELTLPDGKKYKGTIDSPLPLVDPVSQTQSYVIHVPGISSVPENLVATVCLIKKTKSSAAILPKEALLTDETQTEFWIMKMTDSVTAVKIPVTRGLETSDNVEIIDPELKPSDVILLKGNYGLPDTAKVIIVNKN
jgi:multidrug efflux pump subunit AcrA (membrane-fusion protein)